ncbi:MAG TPA: Na+/H+ antiporter subunit C [Spongiibacteraceae bacterium]|nr:Na+/H+ antiporter subunit C [Spongiibacteraceae bacterium]
MELLFAIAIGVLTASGIYLLLRPTIFALILGLALLGYAVNLFLFAIGRPTLDAAPIIGAGERYADPLPQALVLTAIVIGFAMTAFVVALALRARSEWGDDRSEFANDSTKSSALENGASENSISRNSSSENGSSEKSESVGFENAELESTRTENARQENNGPASRPAAVSDPKSSGERG